MLHGRCRCYYQGFQWACSFLRGGWSCEQLGYYQECLEYKSGGKHDDKANSEADLKCGFKLHERKVLSYRIDEWQSDPMIRTKYRYVYSYSKP